MATKKSKLKITKPDNDAAAGNEDVMFLQLALYSNYHFEKYLYHREKVYGFSQERAAYLLSQEDGGMPLWRVWKDDPNSEYKPEIVMLTDAPAPEFTDDDDDPLTEVTDDETDDGTKDGTKGDAKTETKADAKTPDLTTDDLKDKGGVSI